MYRTIRRADGSVRPTRGWGGSRGSGSKTSSAS
jgi:hypothetical protein